MRPSNKSRSRNKGGSSHNNQRRSSMGNIINRVFESAGPDGKVRGTPQQIIDKYEALARDAQVAGDRVAAESYLQHSEHYSRLLGEAQRQQAENRPQEQGENGQQQRADDGGQQGRGGDDGQYQGHGQHQRNDGGNQPQRQPAMTSSTGSGLTMIEPEDSYEISGPIETPEGRRGPVEAPAPAIVSDRAADAPQPQDAQVNGKDHAQAPRAEGEAPAEVPAKRPRTRRRAKADAAPAEVVSQAE